MYFIVFIGFASRERRKGYDVVKGKLLLFVSDCEIDEVLVFGDEDVECVLGVVFVFL